MTWEWATPGSNVWHNGSGVPTTTYSPQPQAFWVHPGGSACFRAFYTTAGNETPYGWDDVPGISAPVCITVKP
ncbi:hypothetical protein [Streptacidiphilus fuscans]|uniref:Uncharacterized protein n=1 Tax=Streptacidiphilus fuscans TaxID=2789292 RepID=A0A931FC54_9ACTN|nr:hypothetical protein [Streptacidiphilus fuscans]MBF9068118.1 hypothetical protein [Streptacidiphilus fuscans]